MTDAARRNDALVREFIVAWERRDTTFIVDCFTADGVYHSMPLTPIWQAGHTQIAGTFAMRDGKIASWREYVDLAPAKAAYKS